MGRTVPPPPPLFSCPVLKISLGNPSLKIIDLTKLFIADAPMKKNSKNLVHPLSEHFEIWVQKPPIAKRVNTTNIAPLAFGSGAPL